MAGSGKKAKLAHEKRAASTGASKGTLFVPNKVVEEVEWPAGQRSVVVDLDGTGRMGIVSSWFATKDKQTGELVPSQMSCPAVYDPIAGQKAIDQYAAYSAQANA